ncbi:MAG TPA: peptidoglycan-binding domain-containing protein [Chthoniobacterales bacterium]
MKKFTSLLIGCSLAFAGFAMGQQPEEQQNQAQPPKKEHAGKKHAAEGAATGANAQHGQPQTQAPAGHQHQGMKHQQAVPQDQNVQAVPKGGHHGAKAQNVSEQPSGQPTTSATVAPTGKQARKQARQDRRAGKGAETAPNANQAATGAATGAAATAAPSVAPNNQPNAHAGGGAVAAKRKLEPQKVQQIKQQHASFRAQPRPDRAPAVTFNQNYRIQGAEHWQGPRYEAFRSYHPQWHDQGFYRSHYNRVELIGGGYYYFNGGYWYPAWGYSQSEAYYPYDGPIYVGQRAEPPDQVIADVQAALQEMGYYKGEVDGLVGPLTREALTAYQADNGLATTAAIDEPTLDSLELG